LQDELELIETIVVEQMNKLLQAPVPDLISISNVAHLNLTPWCDKGASDNLDSKSPG